MYRIYIWFYISKKIISNIFFIVSKILKAFSVSLRIKSVYTQRFPKIPFPFSMKFLSKHSRFDINRNEFGVLIWIREDLPGKELQNLRSNDSEQTYIKLNLGKTEPFGYYHPPSQSDKHFPTISRTISIN